METLWSDFINSEWHDWKGSGRSEDRMGQRKWQSYYLAQWHLPAPVPADEDMVAAMRSFRERLHGMAVRLAAGKALSEEDFAYLNSILDKGAVKRRIETESDSVRMRLLGVSENWEQVMAEVAASFAELLIRGEGARIRVCENPDCRWIFYDDTRNRTKKYCDHKMCGNLMKVRRFRAKRKEEGRS